MATIQGIYIALFGRPADPLGLQYYNQVTNNGANLTLIGDLAGTAEYQDRFTGQNNVQIVNAIYQSLFGRDADLAGLQYFVAELQSGRQNINTIAINILDGAKGDDLAIVNNKITAANNFTAQIDTGAEVAGYNGALAAASGRAYLDQVTADTASIPDQNETAAAVAEAVKSGGATPTGTFTLTNGEDFADHAGSVRNGPDATIPSDFKFTTGNETVVASTATLSANDSLRDNSTSDEDIIQVTVTGNTNLRAITNIENFDVTYQANGNLNFANVTGVKTLDLSGAITATTVINNNDNAGIASINGSQLAGAGFDVDFSGASSIARTIVGSNFADTVVGGAGADNISTGGGIDNITDGAGADVIRAGGGDDVIVLDVDSASDRIVLEATSVANGLDGITGFNGGSTNGDILDVSAFLGEAIAAQVVTLDSIGAAATGVNAVASNTLLIRYDANVTEATLVDIINGQDGGRLTLDANSKYVIALDTDNNAGGAHQVFYVETGNNGLVTELQEVATVGVANDLVAANFA